MTDPATRELGYELHRLLAEGLIAALKRTPSAEMMGVARALLKQEGVTALELQEQDRKRLQRLHRLVAEKLLAAVMTGQPGAAILSEARHFCRDNGVGKDLGAAVSTAQALAALQSTDLPFH